MYCKTEVKRNYVNRYGAKLKNDGNRILTLNINRIYPNDI
jgi:hypothetical protein